jgi:hypothetical protein
MCVCAHMWRRKEREREYQVNTEQALHEYRPTGDFASIEPTFISTCTLCPQCFFIGSLAIWTHAYESISHDTNWYSNNFGPFGQIQKKKSLHTRFNIFTMVLNVCAHHVHSLSIYNHLHDVYTVSTYNNSRNTSVHKSQNCLLIFKLIKILEVT